MFIGSKTFISTNDSVVLFSNDEFVGICGRSFRQDADVVLAMSGDADALPVHVDGCSYSKEKEEIYATFDREWNLPVRINYLIVLAG